MLSANQVRSLEAIERVFDGFLDEGQSIDYEHDLPELFSLKENRASVEAMAQKIYQIGLRSKKNPPEMGDCFTMAEIIMMT